MRNFFKNVIVKTIFISTLPFSLGIFFDNYTKSTGWKVGLILAAVLYVAADVWYAWEEYKEQKDLRQHRMDEQERECDKLMISLANELARENADKLYAHVKKTKDHSEIADWDMIHFQGDKICEKLLEIVKKTAKQGDDFSVSIMFRKFENGASGYTMSSRKATLRTHTPKSYRAFVREADAKGYHYHRLFKQQPSEPDVLFSKADIKKHFKDSTALKYTQYVGIPISCTGNKMVGLIQILAYGHSRIADTREELTRYANEFYNACATFMLLCDKVENAQQVLEDHARQPKAEGALAGAGV